MRLNLFVSGIYAWLATVAIPAWTSGHFAARVFALLALVLLSGGLATLGRHPAIGRATVLVGFVGASAATWLLVERELDVQQLEPVRAASGAVGWMLFAFGWGAVRNVGSIPENDPRVIRGELLTARQTPTRSTYVVFSLSLLGALAPWLLAWRVTRPEHALLAHAAGLACAIAMVSVGAELAVRRGRRRVAARPAERVDAASTSLLILTLLTLFGVAVWLLRH